MRIRFHHEAPDAGSQPPRPEGWSRLPQRQRIALGLTEYWPHFPADASLWQKCDLLESATGVPAWRWRMLRDRAVDALRKHNDSEPAPQPNLSTKSEKQTVER